MKRYQLEERQSTRAPEHPESRCALNPALGALVFPGLSARTGWCTGALVLCLATSAFAETGYGEVKAGNAEYKKGDYLKAIDNYEKAALKNPRQAKIDHNLGAAYYRQGDYARALDHFQRALLSDDEKFVPQAHYALGNTFYKAGIAREDSDIRAAIASLEEALPHYEKTMAADPKDEDAKFNYGFVKKEIERLKQKQQQQQQQQQQQRQQQQQQSQDQDKEQQNSQSEQSPEQKSPKEQEQEQKEGDQEQQQKQDGAAQDEENEGQGSKQPEPDQPREGDKKDGKKDGQDQGKPGDKGSPGQDQQDGEASGQEAEGRISSQKEARMLLEDFDRNEQPKGLLNFIRQPREERPVEKDW